MSKYKIAFAGAGRVAGALSRAFHNAGSDIIFIVSRTEKNARILAENYNALWSMDPVFPEDADIIILAVPDREISDLLSLIKPGENTVVVHTAGSVGLDVFPPHIRQNGVLYPLQTFSHGREVTFAGLPFFIEANCPSAEKVISGLAASIGAEIHFADTRVRRVLHLAAVFSCNFTNYMLTAGKRVLQEANQDFMVLEPLIRETVAKALETGPEKSQTGPAIRSDTNTIKQHIALLSFSPDLQHIYREVTESIMKYYKSIAND